MAEAPRASPVESSDAEGAALAACFPATTIRLVPPEGGLETYFCQMNVAIGEPTRHKCRAGDGENQGTKAPADGALYGACSSGNPSSGPSGGLLVQLYLATGLRIVGRPRTQTASTIELHSWTRAGRCQTKRATAGAYYVDLARRRRRECRPVSKQGQTDDEARDKI